MPSSKKPCNVEECPESYDALGAITYEEEKIAESKDPLAGRHYFNAFITKMILKIIDQIKINYLKISQNRNFSTRYFWCSSDPCSCQSRLYPSLSTPAQCKAEYWGSSNTLHGHKSEHSMPSQEI